MLHFIFFIKLIHTNEKIYYEKFIKFHSEARNIFITSENRRIVAKEANSINIDGVDIIKQKNQFKMRINKMYVCPNRSGKSLKLCENEKDAINWNLSPSMEGSNNIIFNDKCLRLGKKINNVFSLKLKKCDNKFLTNWDLIDTLIFEQKKEFNTDNAHKNINFVVDGFEIEEKRTTNGVKNQQNQQFKSKNEISKHISAEEQINHDQNGYKNEKIHKSHYYMHDEKNNKSRFENTKYNSSDSDCDTNEQASTKMQRPYTHYKILNQEDKQLVKNGKAAKKNALHNFSSSDSEENHLRKITSTTQTSLHDKSNKYDYKPSQYDIVIDKNINPVKKNSSNNDNLMEKMKPIEVEKKFITHEKIPLKPSIEQEIIVSDNKIPYEIVSDDGYGVYENQQNNSKKLIEKFKENGNQEKTKNKQNNEVLSSDQIDVISKNNVQDTILTKNQKSYTPSSENEFLPIIMQPPQFGDFEQFNLNQARKEMPVVPFSSDKKNEKAPSFYADRIFENVKKKFFDLEKSTQTISNNWQKEYEKCSEGLCYTGFDISSDIN